MSRLLEAIEDGRNPALRTCTFCHGEFPEASVGPRGGRTACTGCRTEGERIEAEERARFELEHAEVAPPSVSEVVAGVDDKLRYGGIALRWGTYILAVILAVNSDVISHMLHGYVMADFGTWLATFWIDLKTRRARVVTDATGFIVLTTLMVNTDAMGVPHDGESFGIAFLSFVLFFTIKGSITLVNRIHGDRDEN